MLGWKDNILYIISTIPGSHLQAYGKRGVSSQATS
jgi:hypothetical protein